jgi:hypothetical protein
MALLPWGAWKPDTSDYESSTAVYSINNVLPRGDGYGPFASFNAATQALPAACRGAFYALKSDGSVQVFAGTSTKLYKLNNTDLSWTDVSKGASTYSALSSNANWVFAQTGNLVWATQANAVLQVFDLSSSTAFADGAGSPPQASYISVVGRFLVLSGLLSAPYRVQWSGLNSFNAATSWTSGVASSDFQDFPDGGIVRGVAGGEFGIVFQDQAMRRMSYIPGSALIFQIERITQDMGLFAPYSIIPAGSTIYFYSNKGFYKIAAGGFPEQIGRERIDRTFFNDLDKTNLQLFQGVADPRGTRIFWAYKSGAGASGLFDKLLGYDTALDRFFPVSVIGEYLLGISQAGITLEGLDAISSSIDALTLPFDSYATSVQPQIAAFDSNHKQGFFTGTNLEATLESAEQGTDGQRVFVNGFRPITDAATFYGSCSSRETQQTTPTAGTEVLINSRTGRCDMRKSTRYTRFKGAFPQPRHGPSLRVLSPTSRRTARPDGALRSRYGRDRPEENHHVPAACCGADDDQHDGYCDQYGGDCRTQCRNLRQFDQQTNRRNNAQFNERHHQQF